MFFGRIIFAGLCFLLISWSASAVELVSNGSVRASIVIPAGDKRIEKYADILQHYIRLSSGAELKRGAVAGLNTVKLVIDPARHSDIEEFSFTFPDKNTVVISGGSENGLKFGVYRFLEKYLGLRRLFPGKLGDHLPKNANIVIPPQAYSDKPAYLSRYLGSGAYTAKTREYYDWVRSLGSNNPRIYMGHYLFALLPQSKYGQSNPEFYPEFNGKRVVPQPGQTTFWQPCFTAPGVAKVVAENAKKRLKKGFEPDVPGVNFAVDDPRRQTVSLGVNDAGGYCQCANCRKANGSRVNYAGIDDAGGSYVPFIDRVADLVTAEYPDCRIPFLAYAAVAEIPPGTGKLNKRLVPEITYDSMYTADPKLRAQFRRVFKAWSKSLTELALGDYVYGHNFILPRVNFRTFSEQIQWCYQEGARHYYGECYPGEDWTEGPKVYLICKLLWDPTVDREKVMQEWYECCVGTAAAPYLKQYFANLEQFWTVDVVKTPWFQKKRVYPEFGKRDYLEAYTQEKLDANYDLLKKCAAAAQTPEQKARANYFLKLFEARKGVIETYWKTQAVRKKAASLNFSEPIYRGNFDPHPKHVSFWQRAKRNAKFLRDKTGGTAHSECLLIDAEGSVSGPCVYEVRIPVKSKRNFRIQVKCRAESALGPKAQVSLHAYWRTPKGEMLDNSYRVTANLPRPFDDHWYTLTIYTATPVSGDVRMCIGMEVTGADKGRVRFDDLIVDATGEVFPEEEKYTQTLFTETFKRPRDRWICWQSGKQNGLKFSYEPAGSQPGSGSMVIDAGQDKERGAGIYLKTVPVPENRRILVSAMVKVSENANADNIVQLNGTLCGADGKPLKGVKVISADHPEVRDGQWRRLAWTVTTPAGAAKLKLALVTRRLSPGKVWFDDIKIQAYQDAK